MMSIKRATFGIDRLSYPLWETASVIVVKIAMIKDKNRTETNPISSLNWMKKKQIKNAAIKKANEPLSVFVIPNVLYFPNGHLTPIRAAIGSLIAKTIMGM